MPTDPQAGKNSIPVGITGLTPAGVPSTFVKATANQDLATADIVDNGGVTGQISVPANTATAVRVGASNLANRKRLIFSPISGTVAYWGYANTVTNANGYLVYKNQPVSDSWGPNTTIWIYATVAIVVAISEGA